MLRAREILALAISPNTKQMTEGPLETERRGKYLILKYFFNSFIYIFKISFKEILFLP